MVASAAHRAAPRVGYDLQMYRLKSCGKKTQHHPRQRLWWLLVFGGWLLAATLTAQDLEAARRLYGEGLWRQAAEAFHAAASQPGADPELRARALNNACVVFNDLGDHHRAVAECRQALALRRQLGDHRRLARVLNNLGLSERYLGNFAASRQAFNEALNINRQLGNLGQEVVNLANLGALETEAGRYTDALVHHRLAEQLADQHAEQPWAAEQAWISRVNQGVALELAGAYRPALEQYRRAVADDPRVPPHRRANLRVNLGVVYRNLGDPQRAVAAFAAAAELFQQLGDGSGRANALLNLGLAYHLNLARLDDAELALSSALKAARQGGAKAEELRSLGQLGRLHLDRGQFDQAEQMFQQQFAAAKDSSTIAHWQAENGLGLVQAARGKLGLALPHLLRAVAGVEQQQSKLGADRLDQDDLRWTFLADQRVVYSAAIEVLARLDHQQPGLGHAEHALEIVQQAKARELIETLAHLTKAADKPPGNLPQTPRSAAELLELAAANRILELYLTDSSLLLWQIGEGRIELHDLGPPATVNTLVSEVHRALAAGKQLPQEALAELSRILLTPLATLDQASGTLQIAPDGVLHYLPFELLPTGDHGDQRLIDHLVVSYLPSASALGRRQPPTSDRLVGLADPRLEYLPEQPGTPRELLIERFHLSPLPAATGELLRIAEQWPGESELAVGAHATEEYFRAAVAAPARILHLASHAVLDERPGGSAAIVLGSDSANDGLLYPREIARLEMAVGLTVLSACRTALADDQGRALSSLAGAFLAAGSAAVIATLWDVDDQSSAVFMEQLYHFLGRGLAPADALRQAKLRLHSDPDWDRPSVWAAYVLVGDVGPLIERQRGWTWLLVAAALLLPITAWWLRPRKG